MAKFFWNYYHAKPHYMPERLSSFEEVLEWQERFLSLKKGGLLQYNFILFAEHEPVYAIPPRNNEIVNFDNADDVSYVQKFFRIDLGDPRIAGVPLYPLNTTRGGSITYHGPGQLVCYLIVDIREIGFTLDLQILEITKVIDSAVKEVLTIFGIKGYTLSEVMKIEPDNAKRDVMAANGIWVVTPDHALRKIASRGIALRNSRFATYGFALNISTDLAYFDYIYPCGLDIQMTSIEQLTGKKYIVTKIAQMLAKEFVVQCKKFSGDDSHELI